MVPKEEGKEEGLSSLTTTKTRRNRRLRHHPFVVVAIAAACPINAQVEVRARRVVRQVGPLEADGVEEGLGSRLLVLLLRLVHNPHT